MSTYHVPECDSISDSTTDRKIYSKLYFANKQLKYIWIGQFVSQWWLYSLDSPGWPLVPWSLKERLLLKYGGWIFIIFSVLVVATSVRCQGHSGPENLLTEVTGYWKAFQMVCFYVALYMSQFVLFSTHFAQIYWHFMCISFRGFLQHRVAFVFKFLEISRWKVRGQCHLPTNSIWDTKGWLRCIDRFPGTWFFLVDWFHFLWGGSF